MEKLIFIVYSKSVSKSLGGTANVYCYVDNMTQDQINAKMNEISRDPKYIHVEYCNSYSDFLKQEKEWFKASKGFLQPVEITKDDYISKLNLLTPLQINDFGFTFAEPLSTDIYSHYVFTGSKYFKIFGSLNESFNNLINICTNFELKAA